MELLEMALVLLDHRSMSNVNYIRLPLQNPTESPTNTFPQPRIGVDGVRYMVLLLRLKVYYHDEHSDLSVNPPSTPHCRERLAQC